MSKNPLFHNGEGCEKVIRHPSVDVATLADVVLIMLPVMTVCRVLPVVSGTDVGQPCTPGGTPCADANAECLQNVCTCRRRFFSQNGFCSK